MRKSSPILPGVGHRSGAGKRATVLHLFDRFAGGATRHAGSPTAFVLAVGVVVAWALTGPMFGYSETWQLVINTGTTIVTFLMVFLIQQSQNKDAVAVHLKLNELLASHREASNMLVSIEDLDEEELRQLVTFYRQLAELADQEDGIKTSHSLDEARENHAAKRHARATRGHQPEAPAGGASATPASAAS
ncbi:low affinity iron permease family protein [Cupriavidus alkaliphilus]|uniref:low affinity iron permease family protein n=1 Tax=Cupriavidus alkaliphilus TaxID=942866 RepID=UPI000DC413A4|nr:low affinity iron permease family protein [Cupriavidus alkaliphilus]MBB3014927.1 low affinity Fe/Cu permease [Cupriavidus alkaliphilus]RAS05848.1 low affinity Fe/Cu permease [Cupriavidus alkaliphilus]